MKSRAARTLMLLLMVLMIGSACTPAPPPKAADPTAEISGYAAAWQSGDDAAASALTTDPAAAALTLQRITNDLQASRLTVTPGALTRSSDTTATSPAQVSWELGDAGTWNYQVQWNWILRDGGWKLSWTPANIHPQLGPQQGLVVRITKATDGTLVDRDNAQVLSPVRVYSIVALPGQIADLPGTVTQLMAVLGKFEPGLTADDLVAAINASDPAVGYTVLNLREADFETVRDALAGLTGISTPSQVRNLAVTKDYARSVLGQVTPVANAMMKGTKGWKIVTLDSTGAELATLAEQSAVPGQKLVLTLDTGIEQAAESALAKVEEPAALVAIQPSTGELLAVAQNAPANAQGTIALSGQYPPGSIFKIITASAGIDSAQLTASTPLLCPGRWVVDSRPITNSHEFDLGTVDLRTAFAKSCNTTFAQISSQLPPEALNAAAKSYSVGLDFDMKGAITLTGQSPVATSVVQQAENGFGQGVDLVTPFSAALMAATVAHGSMPTPVLLRGTPTTVNEAAPARTSVVTQTLPVLMRAVTLEGTGTALQSFGEIYLKTGTAEFTDATGAIKAHAWTIGYLGDMAFAALIVGGDDSSRTNTVVQDFLTAAGRR